MFAAVKVGDDVAALPIPGPPPLATLPPQPKPPPQCTRSHYGIWVPIAWRWEPTGSAITRCNIATAAEALKIRDHRIRHGLVGFRSVEDGIGSQRAREEAASVIIKEEASGSDEPSVKEEANGPDEEEEEEERVDDDLTLHESTTAIYDEMCEYFRSRHADCKTKPEMAAPPLPEECASAKELMSDVSAAPLPVQFE